MEIAEKPWFEFRNGLYYERTYWGSLSLSEWPALHAVVQSPDRNKFASIVDDVLCKFDMLAPDRNPADCFLDSMPCIGVLPELCKCYAKDLVRPSKRLAIRVGMHTLMENQSLFHQMKELAVQLPNILSSDFPWPEGANEEFRQKCVFNAKQIIAQTDFARAIPAEVRTLLAPIHYSRLQIMKLLVDCPNARELLKSNPIWAIGLAIYSYDVSNLGCTRKYLKPLGNLSPIEIAELLGFPATDVVVRILAKVSPAWINSERLTLLIELMRDDGMLKILEDVEVLSDLILDLLSIPTFKGRLTSNLLNEVLAESLPTWLFDAREHSTRQHSVIPT